MTTPPSPASEPSFHKLPHLMPFLVREILVASSAYDAFLLEEDGQLDERLITAYRGLSLSTVPRMTHASSAARCIELLHERRFDLVLTVARLEDTDGAELSRLVKQHDDTLPVVLLAFDEMDRRSFPGGVVPSTIDHVFLWTGDAQILVAAIKQVEDRRNAAADAEGAGVQVILVVEDSPRRYSTFLALLYAELMTQSQSLIAEGLNAVHRLMRMRARPKILLATTFEEAVAWYRRFQDHLLGVITDVRFPMNGVEDPQAGFELVRLIRRESKNVPMLMQSADPGVAEPAAALSAWHVDKNSPALLDEIRGFLKEALGFGDFVFRLPDRTEVGRARDLYELEQALREVPAESIEYHARRHHFSTWLNARTMFPLARRMKSRTLAEFKDAEAVRRYLLDEIRNGLSAEQVGVVADFPSRRDAPERHFVRLGKGSIGGKGRGIAFASSYMAQHALRHRFPGLELRIPRTIAIGTGEFDRFLEHNHLSRGDLALQSDHDITRRFLESDLDPEFVANLDQMFWSFRGPLAVRSSSLLEDSRFQPFAGIYATYMLPNNHPVMDVRFGELCRAIKTVYASTFWANARSYLAGTPHAQEEEKMAVVIMEFVGTTYGSRAYPHVSGVAQSYNYYPIGHQRVEDGVALLALGLGETVVSGGQALRFSPGAPGVLPQFSSTQDVLRNSQSHFYALDLSNPVVDFVADASSSLCVCDLADAERDGSLAAVGSVYSVADDAIRDTLSIPGPRVLTFNNILKWGVVPLAAALAELLGTFKKGMGSEIEVEFALDLAPPRSAAEEPPPVPRLHVLQVRPIMTQDLQNGVFDLGDVKPEQIFCRTSRSLGNGRIDDLRDVVYVKAVPLDGTRTSAVAAEVGRINAALEAEERPYLLIGPGRWGSADPALGIPVEWSQIAGARVIVETLLNGRAIEPSQGTHFFQNITALRIAYLTIGSAGGTPEASEYLDADWLEHQPAHDETAAVRHVRLATPFKVLLDGREGRAIVMKPGDPDCRC